MAEDDLVITVREGKIRGFKTKSEYSGVDYYSFLGVPYGQSTAGPARFKDPVPVKPWKTILNATAEKNGCIQFSLLKKKMQGSEDCLYNNIYTTKPPSKGDALKAVIVNFHPGGFFHGSPDPSDLGSPKYVIHHDIVYVCVAHRLHLYGFLNLNMEECSGNQALKDAILSLQWIKKNIAVFGGDPDNITLMGSSSGAVMVHFLLLSPLAKDLYHKVILMGMYVFSPPVVFFKENASTAYEIAKGLGYKGKPGEDKKLLSFMKKMNIGTYFVSRHEYFFSKITLQVYPTSPCMFNAVPGENSPLPVSPEELIPSTNRVPMIIGFCEKEAIMALGLLRTLKTSITESFSKAVSQNQFGWGANLSEDEQRAVQKEVENYYLAGSSIENASNADLCDILTDMALSDVYGSLIDIISADLPSSVYVYNFFYDGKLCTMKAKLLKSLDEQLSGAYHAADYSYWCYQEELAGKDMTRISPKDRQTIDRLTRLLTTFAKTSNPNYEGLEVEWKPTTPEHPSHLIIDETLQVKDEFLNGKRMEFWHRLKTKFSKDRNNL